MPFTDGVLTSFWFASQQGGEWNERFSACVFPPQGENYDNHSHHLGVIMCGTAAPEGANRNIMTAALFAERCATSLWQNIFPSVIQRNPNVLSSFSKTQFLAENGHYADNFTAHVHTFYILGILRLPCWSGASYYPAPIISLHSAVE